MTSHIPAPKSDPKAVRGDFTGVALPRYQCGVCEELFGHIPGPMMCPHCHALLFCRYTVPEPWTIIAEPR